LLLSCGGDNRAWTEKDLWYTGLPSRNEDYRAWPKLDHARIHEVAESKLADAESLLEGGSFVRLDAPQASEFIGQVLPDAPGTTPYLVRGLYLNRGKRQFSVYQAGDRLLIRHDSLGSHAVPMKRQPLVLQLEQSPREVFVYCSMAE
jgi:hypothetical protein